MKVRTEALRRLMVLRGMTQKELAQASGLSTATISQVLNGKTVPRADNLKRLVDALDCTHDDILEW